MRLLEAVVTLAVAAACVTAQTSPTCLDEYMCSFEVADSTGATYSFDFRQLCQMGASWLLIVVHPPSGRVWGTESRSIRGTASPIPCIQQTVVTASGICQADACLRDVALPVSVHPSL